MSEDSENPSMPLLMDYLIRHNPFCFQNSMQQNYLRCGLRNSAISAYPGSTIEHHKIIFKLLIKNGKN